MKPHLFSVLSFMGAWSAISGTIGIWGMVTKKPFVSSSKWRLTVWAILVGLLWFLFEFLSGEGPQTLNEVVLAVGFIVFWTIFVVVVAKYVFPGYTAYGVTNTSFREGLLVSLKKLDLTYEETSTGFRLPAINADLWVSVPESSWTTGGFCMKQKGFDRMLRKIAKEMNDYYRSCAAIEINTHCFRVRALLALLSAVFTGLIFWWKFGKL